VAGLAAAAAQAAVVVRKAAVVVAAVIVAAVVVAVAAAAGAGSTTEVAMSPIMTFRIAFKALGRNKMRTGLTMLGMIIGVAAVITLVALGNGAQFMIEESVKAGGTNMINVEPGSFNQGGARGGQGTGTSLTIEDANAIREEVAGVQYVSVGVRSQQPVIAGNANWFTRVQGTDIDLPLIRAWPLKSGTFFSAQDVEGAAKVCVIGITVNEMLFGADGDGTGQIIRIRNLPFTVLGVMGPKGTSMGAGNMDDQVLAPYTTVMKRLTGQTNIQTITVSSTTSDNVKDVADDIALLLRTRHKLMPGQDDDFFVGTLEEMATMRAQQTQTMTALLAGIAGVSLVVGGIGIMNIMLVSVTERTREIGLRMAIGAKGGDVLMQFLVEAIALSMIGGSIGIMFGFGLAYGMENWMGWPAKVPQSAVAMSFGFAAAVGVFFGFYPAQKAARLDPIDALRFE
jgi:putative ABC transport system permease protein